MGINGRQRGGRALGVAVLVVLLVDPDLADSPGFALSVLATALDRLSRSPWRDALAGWMPRWLAEALAVPAAAQLACTPLVASLSGQVSLVAVAANLLAGPAVGPATVLGLLGAFFGLSGSPLWQDRRHSGRLVRGLDRRDRPPRRRPADAQHQLVLGLRGLAAAHGAERRHRCPCPARPASASPTLASVAVAILVVVRTPDAWVAAGQLGFGGLRRRSG